MREKYQIIFDRVIAKQLRKISKNSSLKRVMAKIIGKIEIKGENAGKSLDLKYNLYEIKLKRPPLRLYYAVYPKERIIKILEFHMKTSEKKQEHIIIKIVKKMDKFK
jgi:mRNA-degrading endonuclease RelE of RelBE toxin-antitoxin system